MKEIKKDGGVKLTLEDIAVNEAYKNEEYGTLSFHLSQERATTYPAKRMDTGFGMGLFDSPEGETYTQMRHTLVNVPVDADVDAVKAQLGNYPDACIFRKLSNDINDVISDREKQAIESELITAESLIPRYVVRDSEGNVYANATQDGEVLEGDDRVVGVITKVDGKDSLEITNENAILEFKRDIFAREYTEDIDTRVKVNVAAEVNAEAGQLPG